MSSDPRLFISYASVPKSGDTQLTAAADLARKLYVLLAEKLKIVVYYFENPDERGELFAKKICSSIDTAHFFLALIGQEYLSSGYCFLEYMLMQRRNTELQEYAKPFSGNFFRTIFTEKRASLGETARAEKLAHEALLHVQDIHQKNELWGSLFPELKDAGNLRAQIGAWQRDVLGDRDALYDIGLSSARTEELSLDENRSELRRRLQTHFRPESKDAPAGDYRLLIAGALKGLEARARAASNYWTQGPVAAALNSACAVSAFSLRFDRFHDGGWGFSFGDLFDRDEKGRLYTRGRFDTNSFILDAISSCLPPEASASENILTLYPVSTVLAKSEFDYEDRIPEITRVACALARPAAFANRMRRFCEDIERIKNEIQENGTWPSKATQRWREINSVARDAGETEDVLTFELLSRIADSDKNEGLRSAYVIHYENTSRLGARATADLDELAKKSADFRDRMAASIQKRQKKFLIGAEEASSLIDFGPAYRISTQYEDAWEGLQSVFQKNQNSEVFRLWYSKSLLCLFGQLFLTRFDSGLEILSTWSQSWISENRFRPDLQNWEALLGITRACTAERGAHSLEVRVMAGRMHVVTTLMLVFFLRLLKLANGRPETAETAAYAKKCRVAAKNWSILMQESANSSLLFQMDSAGWAAVLMATEEIGSLTEQSGFTLESKAELLRRSWDCADAILKERRILLGMRGSSQSPSKKLDAAVRADLINKTNEGFVSWIEAAAKTFPEIRDFSASWKEHLAESSFFNVGFSRRAAGQETVSADDGILIGNLTVRRSFKDGKPKDEISGADSGYNEIFITPIGDILDLHVPDLERLSGLLGDEDVALIDIIGRSAVDKCYQLGDLGNARVAWTEVDFEEVTDHVVKDLVDKKEMIDSCRAYAHLLKIRSSNDPGRKNRWVLRTANLARAKGGTRTPSGEESLMEFRWRFVDVTTAVDGGAMLVLPGKSTA